VVSGKGGGVGRATMEREDGPNDHHDVDGVSVTIKLWTKLEDKSLIVPRDPLGE